MELRRDRSKSYKPRGKLRGNIRFREIFLVPILLKGSKTSIFFGHRLCTYNGITGKTKSRSPLKRGIIMNLKQYTALWALIVIIAAGFGIMGNFTNVTAMVFGFIGFGMVFIGMTSVRSSVVTHPKKRNVGKVPSIKPGKLPQTLLHRMRTSLKDWFVPEQVEVIRHRFH